MPKIIDFQDRIEHLDIDLIASDRKMTKNKQK